MRILHVLDHSLPLHSGYAFRTAAILREQRAMGYETLQLTTPRQNGGEALVEDVDHLRFHRTPLPASVVSGIPGVRYAREIAATARRIDELAARVLARHPPSAFAGARRLAGAAGRAPPRHSGRLRGARVMGGCRGRPWHDARRQPALPGLACARDLGVAPRRSHHDDLRGPARRHRRARHSPGAGHRHSQRGRHPGVHLRRGARSRVAGEARAGGQAGHRLRRVVLRLRRPRPAARGAGDPRTEAAGIARAAGRRRAAGRGAARPGVGDGTRRAGDLHRAGAASRMCSATTS